MKTLMKLMQEYDDGIHLKIASLEKEIISISHSQKESEQKWQERFANMIRLFSEKIEAPIGLEFDGRSCNDDLQTFAKIGFYNQSAGKKYYDTSGRYLPWKPNAGFLHRKLDQAAGYPNTTSSPRQMSSDEMNAYVGKRDVWVNALLEELDKVL